MQVVDKCVAKPESLKIHFLGGAQTVTGSKYLLEFSDHCILVDCGLFQGKKELRQINWEHLPLEISKIDFVLLTHAHIDHSGYLPKLVQAGFKGRVLATSATIQITKTILLDSAKIHEEYAKKANFEGFSKHKPAKPLYSRQDAEKTLSYLKSIDEGAWVQLFEHIRVRYNYNGHILGSCSLDLDIHGSRYVFSGDVGRETDLLLPSPKQPLEADVLFLESTYGDVEHKKENVKEYLMQIINKTVLNNGVVLIPSFAVERAQALMYILWKLKEEKKIPNIPMILDSPMASKVLEVFKSHHQLHKLNSTDIKRMKESFKIVESYRETWEVIDSQMPKIVIAGSGMVTGGRILTYLSRYINKKETGILLVGFQADGTRGRKLLEGEKSIKIMGKYYDVKASIYHTESLSAHADQKELVNWVNKITYPPKKIFIVHGEPLAAKALQRKLKEIKKWDAQIPKLFEIIELPFKPNSLRLQKS